MGNPVNDTTLRNHNIRKKLTHDLPELRKVSISFDVSVLAKRYNTTRTTIGRLLAERAEEVKDIRRKRITQNYCPAVWEFV